MLSEFPIAVCVVSNECCVALIILILQTISRVRIKHNHRSLNPFHLTMILPDLDTAHGSEIWAKYINRHTGRRSDAATGTKILSFY